MKRIEGIAYKLLSGIIAKRRAAEPQKKAIKAEEGQVVTDEDDREKRSKAVITRTNPRENRLRHILTELFLDQQQRVNAMLDQGVVRSLKEVGDVGKRKSNSVNEIADMVVNDTDVFAETVMPFLRDIINAEGIAQIQSLVDNAVFYMQTPAIQRFLRKDGVKFIATINQETASQIQDELIEAVGQQESIAQMKARIQKVFDDANGYRSERIARTEVLRSTNFATDQAYVQSGVVEAKEWLTAHDERTCPWCGPQDGKVIELGESFFEQGDTVTGTNDKGKKVYLQVNVDDVDFPPLHPNCRCTLIPVLKESDKSLT